MDRLDSARRHLLQHSALGLDRERRGDDRGKGRHRREGQEHRLQAAAIMEPTMFGPIIEAKRSHAVAVPTPSARTRVG